MARRAIASSATRVVLVGTAVSWLSFLAVFGATPEAAVEEPKQPGGHERMVALLKVFAERTADENVYLGDAVMRKFRKSIAARSADPPKKKIKMQIYLAKHLLRLGKNDEAIRQLGIAQNLLAKVPEGERRATELELAYEQGMAYLRWGEVANCITRHTADSCILPIRGGGVHTDPKGSRTAIEHFGKVMRLSPPGSETHVVARWLSNIAYMTLGEYPDGVPEGVRIPAETFAPGEPFPRFVNIAPRLGLDSFNLSGGAIADDFDGDGLIDIVTSTWDATGPMHYFKNDGDGSFTERADAAGLRGIVGGLNMVHADYDNDGDPDVLVLRGAWLKAEIGRQPNSLLRNDGKGNFRDVTFEAGLGHVHYPTQTASWADYDNDGDLDLFIGNEASEKLPSLNQLFRNNGDGTFTDVAKAAGVAEARYSKAVVWGDYDGDRFPDLYVSNLQAPNQLFHNNGDGTFTDVAPKLEVTGPIDSFPAWFWDYDNDGALDLFVSSYCIQPGLGRTFAVAASYEGLKHPCELARLYRGDGKGGFAEVASRVGLDLLTMPMGSNFGDLDNDGFLDFYLGTGFPSYDGLMPNVMFHNRKGERFSDVSTAGGFGHLQKGHAVAFADLDGDGDQDVFEQMGGAYPGDAFGDVFYENPGFGTHWIKIELVGVRSNRSGIGARIRAQIVEDGKRRSVYRHVTSGGSFGGNPLMQHIGLGKAQSIELLEVFWPTSDLVQSFREVAVDQTIRIREGEEEYAAISAATARTAKGES